MNRLLSQIVFQDAVTAKNLNPNQTHAVFYADGRYANHWAVAQACPHAKLYGITVTGLTGPGVFACDCEPGDLTPAQAEAWAAEQIRLGVKLVCVYASLDTWLSQGLKVALAKYGSRIKRWVADFNNVAQIQPWADAEQYADPGPVDLNVALATFFGDAPPAPAPEPPAPYKTFAQGFNGGFNRGFTVGWCRRHRRGLPAYVKPAGQAVAYDLGFQAGFVRGWVK